MKNGASVRGQEYVSGGSRTEVSEEREYLLMVRNLSGWWTLVDNVIHAKSEYVAGTTGHRGPKYSFSDDWPQSWRSAEVLTSWRCMEGKAESRSLECCTCASA